MGKLNKRQTERALNYSIIEGAADSGKEGFVSRNFLVAFVLALGASNEMIGLMVAIPQLAYTLAQFFTTRIMRFYHSKKKVAIKFAFLSRILWIPVVLIPFIPFLRIEIFIALVSIIYVFSTLAGTAWTSWIYDLVPHRRFGRFFGKRNMMIGFASFLATIIGGWVLGLYNSLIGFSVLFFLAFVLGMVSNFFLQKIPEVKKIIVNRRFHFSYSTFLRGVRDHENYSNFVFFVMFVKFAVFLMSPFLVVYMLNNLGIGYLWFGIAIAIQIFMNIISQPYWGKISDRFGDKKTMVVVYSLIPLIPLFWIFAETIPHIIFIQIFSGFLWGGFNLSSFNYLLDSAPKVEQTTFIANYKMFVGLSTVIGPIMGGILAQYFSGMVLLSITGLQILFLLSFVIMVLVGVVFLPRLHSIRIKKRTPLRTLFVRAIAIYPITTFAHEIAYIVHYIRKIEKDLVRK